VQYLHPIPLNRVSTSGEIQANDRSDKKRRKADSEVMTFLEKMQHKQRKYSSVKIVLLSRSVPLGCREAKRDGKGGPTQKSIGLQVA